MSTINWSPMTAMLMDKPVTTVVFGTLGKGKTFFLLNVAANEIGMGRRVIAIDPKNDFAKLKNVSPRSVDIIDINNIHEGAMNPFTFLDDIDTTTILTTIEILTGKLDRETETAITPIIQDFVTKYKRENEYKDMQDVADYLYSRDNKYAQAVGISLKSFEDSKYGKLLFTRKTDIEPLILNPRKSLVISLFGMALPDQSVAPEDYRPEERFTATIVYLLTKKLRKILTDVNKLPTTLICDEAHLLFCNKEMTRVITEYMSLGRSLKTAIMLSSQGVDGFPEITKYVSTRIMFGNSLNEAEKFLNMFDSNKHDVESAIDMRTVTSSIAKLEKGQCFMIDAMNRYGFVQIKSIYDHSLLTSTAYLVNKKE